MKSFLNKIKIPSLYVLSFVLSVLPVAVYLIINHERYVSTTPERIKLLFGGILAIGILVIKTLGFLKVKSSLLFFGVMMIMSYLLESIIYDLLVFSCLAFLGEALSMGIRILIRHLKGAEGKEQIEGAVKRAIEKLSGRV